MVSKLSVLYSAGEWEDLKEEWVSTVLVATVGVGGDGEAQDDGGGRGTGR